MSVTSELTKNSRNFQKRNMDEVKRMRAANARATRTGGAHPRTRKHGFLPPNQCPAPVSAQKTAAQGKKKKKNPPRPPPPPTSSPPPSAAKTSAVPSSALPPPSSPPPPPPTSAPPTRPEPGTSEDPTERHKFVEVRLEAKQREVAESRKALERAKNNLDVVQKLAALKVSTP